RGLSGIAMANVMPSGHTLGASVEGVDLSRPLSAEEFGFALNALAEHGVLRYPRQELTALHLRDFSARWGELEINVANMYQEPGVPEVMILSNIVENGRPIGLADAGQSWHTDMSYSKTIAFCNVLYGIRIPQRNGEPLGNTEFCDQRAAYDELPAALRKKLEGKTVLHDFNKFWEMMRREKGSARPALTEAQRKAKPPVSHPIFLPTPSPGARRSMPTRATRCASTSCRRRKATRSSSSCSSTRPGRNSASRRAGRWATC